MISLHSCKLLARELCFGAYRVCSAGINLVCPPTIVLAYHRVAPHKEDPLQLTVTPQNFTAQLEVIAETFDDVLRFDAAQLHRTRPAVCLTFDDGYADNYSIALPILERFKMTATFFVSTGHVEHGRPYWWEALSVCGKLEDHGRILAMPPLEQHKAVYALLEECAFASEALEECQPLTVAALQEFSRHPLVCLGAHTHTHPRLSNLGAEDQYQQIKKSLDKLESWTAVRPTVAAYPFGARSLFGRFCDYNADSMQACRRLGLKRAAANFPGQVRPWTSRYAIPRHLVRDWDGAAFKAKLRTFLTRGYF